MRANGRLAIRTYILCSAVVLALIGSMRSSPAANAQVPDFSGLWVRTNPITFSPVPGEGLGDPVERLAVQSVDAAEIMAGNFEDPILQPWARELVKKNAEAEIRLEHVNTSDDTCWPLGVPQVLNLRETVQVLQTSSDIVILYQRDYQVRRIALRSAHSADAKPSWYGDSVAHYEGDTLVVDTVRQKAHPMSVVDNYGTPHTDQIHVVERYRRITDARGPGLEVRFRVEDPGAFTRPWGGVVVYRPSANRFEEVVCAENNRSFEPGSAFGQMPQETRPVF